MKQVKLNRIAKKDRLILKIKANASLKSRVRENRKHGSVGVTIVVELLNLREKLLWFLPDVNITQGCNPFQKPLPGHIFRFFTKNIP